MIDGDDLTNGVRAQLITADDGVSLHGIKVLWTIKSEYLSCQLSNLRLELNPGQHSRDITVNNRSADFYNLDCNEQYTPRVTAVVSATEIQNIGDGSMTLIQLSLLAISKINYYKSINLQDLVYLYLFK